MKNTIVIQYEKEEWEWMKKKAKKLLDSDGVPEHVKNYYKHNHTYKSKGENKLRAWF